MVSDIVFPPVETADEDGIVLWGAALTPAWLLAGYRCGIFAWPCDSDDASPVPWFSPLQRAIFEYDRFHVSRRLRQTIASGRFSVRFNCDFAGVLQGCRERREQDGPSWLTPTYCHAFAELHAQGYAHSVESWCDGRLVGGVYGVAIGGYFSAESMFFRRPDASKVALAALVQHVQACHFTLLDIQVATEHTRRLGACEISRAEFLSRLDAALKLPRSFGSPRMATACGATPSAATP